MGATPSKTEEDIQQEDISEGSIPSTPILTPKIKAIRELDPRSPSNNVIRTPIETILMKYNTLKDAPISVIDSTPRLKYLNIDPRSPTTDFNRTPIVILHSTSDTSLKGSPTTECITNSTKRKSYVLLETNLDYIETDIDAAYLKNASQRKSIEIKKKEYEKCNIIITSDDTVEVDELKDLEKEIASINLNSHTIERVEGDKQLADVSKDVPENLEEIPDIFDDVPNKNSSLKSAIEITAENPSTDLTVVINNVKDFDIKLTNLIYEDADSPVVKREDGMQIRDRTPLAIRNGNANSRRKVPKLKVTDRPKKLNNQFSRIPVSKHCKKNKFTVQCENTPPGSLRERKGKSKAKKPAEWDADKTFII